MKTHRMLLLLSIVYFVGCTPKNVKEALNEAGENRIELDKVISHYKEEGNDEKLKAAYFLIANMPYRRYYAGEEMEKYEFAYNAMSAEPIGRRYMKFAELEDSVNYGLMKWVTDATTIKANYLIKNIDEAYNTWKRASWSKDYDISYFYKYVLPYRIAEERPTNWRISCKSEVENLLNTIWSERGVKDEAEYAVYNNSEINIEAQASNQQIVAMDGKNKSDICFPIATPLKCKCTLGFYYTTAGDKAATILQLNDKTIDTLHFAPTDSWGTFHRRPARITVDLPKGNNKIKLIQYTGKVGIDYMETATIDNYSAKDIPNFSGYLYNIINKATSNYITFDTVKLDLNSIYKIKVQPRQSKGQLLRVAYVDYGYWKIETARKKGLENACLDVLYVSLNKEGNINRWNYLKGAHQKWAILPVGNNYYRIVSKDSGLALESQTDITTGADMLVQNVYMGNDNQKWKFKEVAKDPYSPDNVIERGSAIDAAARICDKNVDFEWTAFKGAIPPDIIDLLKKKVGNCREESAYILSLLRMLGIPSAIDFAPHWANRSQGHLWNVLLKPDGGYVPFYMGSKPGDTTNAFHQYKKPKVYRRQFEANRAYINNLKKGEQMPPLFQETDYTDVSREYFEVADVMVEVPKALRHRKFAYICVFNNKEWVPVHLGEIKDGKVLFTDMGRGIAYMAAVYQYGELRPFGTPIIIEESGEVKSFPINKTKKITLNLNRKYPFLGKDDFFNYRMLGGRFQGSNVPDFSEVTDIYTFLEITEGRWYECMSENNTEFKYVRYVGPKGSSCNINELAFYDRIGKKLTGKIIGTDGYEGATIDKVFDGDILTGFNARTADGNWVGLKLTTPSSIGKIRFIPRNDGNCIEIGDEYELMYWDGGWKSCGKKTAVADTLTYNNIPSGVLYLLHNNTKGSEERIFTYEDGKQIWW